MDDKHNSQSGPKDEPESGSGEDHQALEEVKPEVDLEEQKQRLPYPKSVFFIVTNEFCERFSFYGMRTILSLYLKTQLDFSDSTSTVIFHIFVMICYFFPLLGAVVADSWLGKYRTILYLSMVYAIGNIVVSTAAIPGAMPPVPFTMLGLVLIAFGTGGIKPCVAAFGGDQFKLPQQEDQLEKFFSIFYFAINSGSLVSTFITPILREVQCFEEDSCYSLAFGVPAVLMVVAIVIYICGRRWYKIKEPEGNVVVKVAQCMWYAAKNKTQKGVDHWLDKAQDKYEKGFIDDIKAALRVLVLYIPLPIFWALFDQQGSRWTFQAARMTGEIGSFKLEPDQMQVVNPLLILAFIPLFETVLYPTLAKCNLLKRPLQRMTVGGILAALSFGISAIVEIQLESTYPVLPQPLEGQIRLYNGFPENLTVEVPGLIPEELEMKGLSVWEKLNVPVTGSKTFSVRYNKKGGQPVDGNITVYEDQATSYTFMSDRLLEVRNENTDKSDNGNPKLMIVYSDPLNYQKKTFRLSETSGDRAVTFVVAKTDPYVNYTKVFHSKDKYVLKMDDELVFDDVEFKQGGGYVILIAKEGNQLKKEILTITAPNSMHMLWMVPQYVTITAGEIMFSITGLEFSFTQAPVTMKSLLQAAWLMTVAIGNLVVVIVAEAKLFSRQTYEFILFGSLMLVDMLIFALMAMRYTYVEDLKEGETDPEESDRSETNKG